LQGGLVLPGGPTLGENIVPKKKCGFGVAVTVAFAVALSGCSDNRARQAGKELRGQVDKAQCLCNRAMTLMRNVVFVDKSTKETSPLSKDVTDPGRITFPKPTAADAVNRKAIDALDRAAGILKAAIGQYASDADKADVALAYLQQARTHALRAHYQRAAAYVVRIKVLQFIQKVEQAAQGLRTKTVAVRYYSLLAAEKNKQAEKTLALEKAKASDLAGALAELDDEIGELKAKKEVLSKLMDKRDIEARDLLVKSRQPAPNDPAGMAMLEKALAKQSEVGKAAAQIAGIEGEIDVRNTRRGTLALKLDLAKSVQRIMQAILDASRGSVARSQAELDTAKAALAEDGVKVASDTRLLADLCQDFGDREKLAAECLSQAADAWAKALLLLSDRTREVAAQKGDTHMAWAQLNTSRLRFRARIDRFADAMKTLWEKVNRPQGVPASVHGMGQAYLAGAADVKKQAETQYQQAVESYAKALKALAASDVGPQLRWAYQGQLATAYIGLYQLTGDKEKRDEARDLLAKALEGRESSRYLKSLVWFHRQLQQ